MKNISTTLTAIALTVIIAIAGLSCSAPQDIGATNDGNPDDTWDRTYDIHPNRDGVYNVRSVQQTSDGGYVVIGGGSLITTDSDGVEQWVKNSGDAETYRYVQQTSDNGYIIVGYKRLTGMYRHNVLLTKMDPEGNEEWSQTFDSLWDEKGSMAEQTADGGYIIMGTTRAQVSDILLIKTDSEGNEEWNRSFGFSSTHESGRCVQQTEDGGYIMMGYTWSEVKGEGWLVRIDSDGEELWNQTFKGGNAHCVQQTLDGGYIMASGNLVIRTNSVGEEIWNRDFGGRYDYAYCIRQTTDGGYIIAGDFRVEPKPGLFSCNRPAMVPINNALLMKLDADGKEQWSQTYGDDETRDGVRCVRQTEDGGYVLAGWRDQSVWLVKTGEFGETSN